MKTTITGLRAECVRRAILLNIVVLALQQIKKPFAALKILRQVKAKRREVQGLRKIRKFVRSGRRYYFSDDVPGWPSAAFNTFFRLEISRASSPEKDFLPPSFVFLSVTSKCPMRCRHCYELENLSDTEFLSYEDLREIIADFKTSGVSQFQLCGGEPMERIDDLLLLVSSFSKDTDFWINTSGYNLNAENALLLKKAGLKGVEISLDHWSEEEHNLFRGDKRSFAWARDAARNCREARLITSLSLCTTPKFVTGENLKKYAELAIGWGVSFIRILEPMTTGRFGGDDTRLSDEQIALLEEFFMTANSPSSKHSLPIVSYPGYNQRRNGCVGAGNRYLYIDPRGNIHACPFCPRPAGNILTDSLETTITILRSNGCMHYKTNRDS
jgi:MoaA/NifB/PqqE/SkfB family radical SAM enzyme